MVNVTGKMVCLLTGKIKERRDDMTVKPTYKIYAPVFGSGIKESDGLIVNLFGAGALLNLTEA